MDDGRDAAATEPADLCQGFAHTFIRGHVAIDHMLRVRRRMGRPLAVEAKFAVAGANAIDKCAAD